MTRNIGQKRGAWDQGLPIRCACRADRGFGAQHIVFVLTVPCDNRSVGLGHAEHCHSACHFECAQIAGGQHAQSDQLPVTGGRDAAQPVLPEECGLGLACGAGRAGAATDGPDLVELSLEFCAALFREDAGQEIACLADGPRADLAPTGQKGRGAVACWCPAYWTHHFGILLGTQRSGVGRSVMAAQVREILSDPCTPCHCTGVR